MTNPNNPNAGPFINVPANNAQANAYLKTRVMTANPEELRLLLLDGAIKFARQGLEGLERKDFEASFNGISQCRNIIFELLTTIRTDLAPELAANVRSLYTFMYAQTIEASHEKDAQKLGKVIELLEYERETWVMLMQKLAEERAAHKHAPAQTPAVSTGEGRSPFSVSA